MYRYLIAVMLSFVFLLSICGCSKKQNETTDATTEPAVVTEASEAAVTEPVGGIAASPVNDGDLDENGDVIGADVSVIATVPQTTKPTDSNDSTDAADATDPTDHTDATEESVENTIPTSATEPTETTAPTVPEETKPVVTPGATQELTEYEKYNAMSGEDQMAYMLSFDSVDAFFAWYNNAKAEYEAAHPDIEIGDGIIDADDLVG